MYRAVTWAALQQNLDIYEAETIGALAQRMKIDVTPLDSSDQPGQQCIVHVDGQNIAAFLRTLDIDQNVSIVETHAPVRQALSIQQRRIGQHYGSGIAEKRDIVMAGRDIGTVVLPESKLKVYMDATLVENARRRFCEVRQKGRKGADRRSLQRSNSATRSIRNARSRRRCGAPTMPLSSTPLI